MAKFKLSVPHDMDNTEVALQFQFGPPSIFKTVNDAEDWASRNLPMGVFIQIHDGRKKLRAEGINGLLLIRFK